MTGMREKPILGYATDAPSATRQWPVTLLLGGFMMILAGMALTGAVELLASAVP